MLFNWLRWYSCEDRFVRKAIRPRRRLAFQPHVEHLENRLVPATTSIVHSFAGPSTDGASPSYGGLMADSNGNLFGTTSQGGASNQGTVFELVKSGNSYTQLILYSFAGGATDGASPYGGLVADSSGNLFGTTQEAGAHALGTVFELVKNGNSYTETVLYSFAGGAADGAHPDGTLIMDGAGNLFGTTHHGGGANISIGVGTVFEMVKNGSSYNAPTILHAFAGGTDGSYLQFGVIADASGNLFGTTNQGGDPGVDPRGNGTVFELVKGPSGYTKVTLYAFAGPTDASGPYGTLIMDASGNLFGATHGGGTNGIGAVYELTKNGSSYTESVLYSFAGGDADGGFPDGGLVMDSNGNLFGTTALRGQNNNGTVFELVKSGNTYTESVLHFFSGPTADGSEPAADLIMDRSGNIFGTTLAGGASGKGTVFEVSIPASLTHNQRFVTSVYQQLLNRNPEPAGLAHWTGQLDSGVSPSSVVQAIETAPSNEYLTDLVTAAYQHYLKRTPDAGGLKFWVNQLVQSGSIAGTIASMVSSPEYFADQGATNTGYINGLYTDVLGRAPDPSGQAFWVGALNGGGARNQAPLAFQSSKEYLTDLVNGGPWTPYNPLTNWGGYFPQLLHRSANSDELNYYVNQLISIKLNVPILAAIFGSAEGYGIWS